MAENPVCVYAGNNASLSQPQSTPRNAECTCTGSASKSGEPKPSQTMQISPMPVAAALQFRAGPARKCMIVVRLLNHVNGPPPMCLSGKSTNHHHGETQFSPVDRSIGPKLSVRAPAVDAPPGLLRSRGVPALRHYSGVRIRSRSVTATVRWDLIGALQVHDFGSDAIDL